MLLTCGNTDLTWRLIFPMPKRDRVRQDSPAAGRRFWREITARESAVTGPIVVDDGPILRQGDHVPKDYSVFSVASSERFAEMTHQHPWRDGVLIDRPEERQAPSLGS